MLNDVVSEGYLFAITSLEQGLHKLLAGRSDVFIDFPGRISALIESLDLSLAGIHVNEFEDDIVVYPVLHRRHADLAQHRAQARERALDEHRLEEMRVADLDRDGRDIELHPRPSQRGIRRRVVQDDLRSLQVRHARRDRRCLSQVFRGRKP